jgi:hypothetical protein
VDFKRPPGFLRDWFRADGVVGMDPMAALVDIVKRLACGLKVESLSPSAVEEFTAIGGELKVACRAPDGGVLSEKAT